MNEALPWFGVIVALLGAAANYGAMRAVMNQYGKRLDNLSGTIKEVIVTAATNTRDIAVMLVKVEGIVADVGKLERNYERDRENANGIRSTNG